MEKECCQINVTELDNGYRIEITGEDVKEKCNCPQILQQCCGDQQKATTDEKSGCC
jgi:hypothetical protein